MTDRLGNQHVSALLTLMVFAREVSNSELRATAGFAITGDIRRDLNKAGYVESRMIGRAFAHELTEAGWARCAQELTNDVPARPGPLGAALYMVLAGLDRFLERKKLRLADVFQPDTPAAGGGLEARIRTAYTKLARKPRDWVRLAELRPLLNGASKAEVDEVLREMSRDRRARIAAISNSKLLTDADHAAAVRIGGQDNHQIAVEES
jgi:hypothetical protein